MAPKAAKPGRGAKVAPRHQPRSSRSPPDEIVSADAKTRPRPPARSAVMRLAAEVDALAAQLKDSRARIQDLESLVDIDPLTDTLNRRGFARELKRSLAYVKRYGTRAALIYVDLDSFKPVNDRHGHNAGDAVLKAVAASLIRNVRASDVVARYGGDEFVVLVWNVDEAAVETKARALERAVYATRVQWGSSSFTVGASAGVAALGALDTPDEVIARADAAMYARKRERKGLAAANDKAAVRQ